MDLNQSDESPSSWSVGHRKEYKAGDKHQLSIYLEVLRKWSSSDPEHDVITVTLDLKRVARSSIATLAADLDSYLEQGLDRSRVFTPAALMDKLRRDEAAGLPLRWPTLAEMAGKFVLCLSGDKDAKKAYRGGSNPLCFTDSKARTAGPVDGIFFYNLDWSGWHPYRTGTNPPANALRSLAANPLLVTRAYILNAGSWWRAAQRVGINILATDSVAGSGWARVGKGSDVFGRAGGNPARFARAAD